MHLKTKQKTLFQIRWWTQPWLWTAARSQMKHVLWDAVSSSQSAVAFCDSRGRGGFPSLPLPPPPALTLSSPVSWGKYLMGARKSTLREENSLPSADKNLICAGRKRMREGSAEMRSSHLASTSTSHSQSETAASDIPTNNAEQSSSFLYNP